MPPTRCIGFKQHHTESSRPVKHLVVQPTLLLQFTQLAGNC